MKKQRAFFIILILFIAGSLSCQSAIIINTDVDTSFAGMKIPLQLKLKGISPTDSIRIAVLNINNDQSAGYEVDFEISDHGKWKGSTNSVFPGSLQGEDSETIGIRIWDEGKFLIVPLLNDQKIDFSDTLSQKFPGIVIMPSIDPADSLKYLAPIKDIMREKKLLSDYVRWYHILIFSWLIIVLGIMIYLKYKKKPEIIFESKGKTIEISPHMLALAKLEKLKDEKIWLKGNVKEFHQQLTYILREYLEKRLDIKALEQSTTEIMQAIDGTIDDKEHLNTISEILQISDLIKFAKANMGENMNEKFLDRTIDLIKELQGIGN